MMVKMEKSAYKNGVFGNLQRRWFLNQTPTEEQIPAILFCYFWQEGAEADQYFVR